MKSAAVNVKEHQSDFSTENENENIFDTDFKEFTSPGHSHKIINCRKKDRTKNFKFKQFISEPFTKMLKV